MAIKIRENCFVVKKWLRIWVHYSVYKSFKFSAKTLITINFQYELILMSILVFLIEIELKNSRVEDKKLLNTKFDNIFTIGLNCFSIQFEFYIYIDTNIFNSYFTIFKWYWAITRHISQFMNNILNSKYRISAISIKNIMWTPEDMELNPIP
jgi:hypothetical protein